MNRHDIYTTITSLAQPGQLPGLWRQTACHPAFRLLSPEALATLGQRTPVAELLAAGLLTGSAAVPRPQPALGEDPPWILATQRAEHMPPDQLIASLHGLSPHIGAVAATLLDWRLAGLRAISEEQLFVAFSMVDLAILWSLDLPAIPCTGLSTLGGEPLRRICRALGLTWPPTEDETTPAGERGAAPWASIGHDIPLSLILVDFSLAELADRHCPHPAAIARHVAALHTRLEVPLSCSFWKPSTTHFSAIAFALQFGLADQVREALLSCADAATYEHEYSAAGELPRAREHTESPANYFAAGRRWLDCDQATTEHDRVARWKSVEALQLRDLVAPLQHYCLRIEDPIERSRLALAASQLPLALNQALKLEANLRQYDHGRSLPTERQIKELIALQQNVQQLLGRSRE